MTKTMNNEYFYQRIFLNITVLNIFKEYMVKFFVCLVLFFCTPIAQIWNWTKPSELNQGLPFSVQIFTLKMTNTPFHTKLAGAFARFNMNDTNLQFVIKDTNGDALGYFPKTPQQYALAQQNIVYAVINGGYFNMKLNTSASFIAEKGRVKCKNVANQDDKNHPTVGAFGLTDKMKFQAQYIYSYGPQLETYSFRYPNIYPGPIPNKYSGSEWRVIDGIGAGPILIKNKEIIKGNLQNFDQKYIMESRHPRSSICIDQNNRLYFVVIDGRYTKEGESDGVSISQLSQIMQSLNCVDAMNLDGGGSTNLYANGMTINKPSDQEGPRPVVSAIIIRDRYKKKRGNINTRYQ